jgi:hypothetical protein
MSRHPSMPGVGAAASERAVAFSVSTIPFGIARSRHVPDRFGARESSASGYMSSGLRARVYTLIGTA